MSEITIDEKVKFLKLHFPKPTYRIYEIADFFGYSVSTIERCFVEYAVPSIKLSGSPIIYQENLINFLLRADSKNFNELNNIGLEFCINDLKKSVANTFKQVQMGAANGRNK